MHVVFIFPCVSLVTGNTFRKNYHASAVVILCRYMYVYHEEKTLSSLEHCTEKKALRIFLPLHRSVEAYSRAAGIGHVARLFLGGESD